MGDPTTVPDVLPVTGVGIIKGSRLCNFPTGKDILLISHQDELDKILDIIRKSPGYWIEIEGFASHAGDEAFNKDLSEKRTKSVRSYLEQGVNKLNVTVDLGFGEDESGGGERNNDGMWRAVTVRVYANKPPPKPKPAPVVDNNIQKFAIRINSAASLAIPIVKLGQLDLFSFFVVDRDRNRCATYQYTGPSAAAPSPFAISPVSFSDKGPWTTFQILRHDLNLVRVVLADFADKANLIQTPGAQAGSASVGSVQLTFESQMIKKKNCGVIPGGLNLSGGSGFQCPAAGSIGFGTLKQIGEEDQFEGTIIPGQIT
jgi:hypothetical protein